MAAAKSKKSSKTPLRSKGLRTRERLLDTAAELFQAHGIAEVSLDSVAAHAGVTKGAIYGNFASKDDLVFAVTLERTSNAIPVFDDQTPLRDQLRDLVSQRFGLRSKKKRAQFAFLADLAHYSLSRESLAGRFMKFARESHERSAANIARMAREDGLSLKPVELSIVVTGMLNGLLFQHGCFPDIVTSDVVSRVLGTLLRA